MQIKMEININNSEYIQDLENFITDELLPAYIHSKTQNGMNPNQSYIIKKLLTIMKSKHEVPALFKSNLVKKKLI